MTGMYSIEQFDAAYMGNLIRWILLTPTELNETMLTHLWRNVSIGPDSDVTLATWNSSDESFLLEQCNIQIP